MSEPWMAGCVAALEATDETGRPEDRVRGVVEAYEAARRPEWAEVQLSNLLAERDELRVLVEAQSETMQALHEALLGVVADRERARRWAVRWEQEAARLTDAAVAS